MGDRSQWALSHGLFSSFAIDEGTKLLLKTIAQQLPLENFTSMLDVGCGIGVIGGVIKKRFPNIEVSLQDRDALALQFSSDNFKRNGIQPFRLIGDLALHGLTGSYDLICSNVPAKTGIPVIEEFIRKAPGFLNPGGIIAVVVISSLEDSVRQAIETSGGEVIYHEKTRNHGVLHYYRKSEERDPDFASYIRNPRLEISAHRNSYSLSTAFDLPEFDTLSYASATAFRGMKNLPLQGEIGIYNPGQGHLPMYLSIINRNRSLRFHLFSRDILQLRITSRNLGAVKRDCRCHHIPFPDILAEAENNIPAMDCLCVLPEKIPGVPIQRFRHSLGARVKTGGHMLFIGSSSFLHPLTKEKQKGYHFVNAMKHRGYQLLVYQKS